MVIIVYAAETKETIADHIGVQDYSYYFVLEKYRKILSGFGSVREVRRPEEQVDVMYSKCRQRGEPCLFMSFTPPYKALVGLACPTLCVFAWEYATIPTDVWGNDPRHDWRTVLRRHGCAITHSNFAVRAVRQAMGDDFPVWSIPAPVWDDFAPQESQEERSACISAFDLHIEGALIDFSGHNAVDPPAKQSFVEARSTAGERLTLCLSGFIYTAVFNPNDGRKNWLDLLRGFVWAFREHKDVTLVMKLVYHDYESIRPVVLAEIRKLEPFMCRIVVISGFLKDDDYKTIVQRTTYIVNTAHGEGQCLPLMEYMSAGVPAVTPGHTAMEDYINSDNAFVVRSSPEWIHWPHDPRAALRTMRYRINWESLYHACQESYDVAKNKPKRYAQMSRCAVSSLRQFCSQAIAREGIKAALDHCDLTRPASVPRYMRRASLALQNFVGRLRG